MGKVPNFLCTSKSASVPGTPEAKAEAVLFPSITFPFYQETYLYRC
jgi:hypothetical protein